MTHLPRSNWTLALLMMIATALGAATLRAAAQSVMTGTPVAPAAAAAAPGDQAKPPSDPARPPSDPAKPPSDEPKQPPDQTKSPSDQAARPAPDIHGSADNNVSFPVDI